MDIKRNIKYVVIDLDGTLLNDEHKMSERNKQVIKKATDSGIKVMIATGKTRKSAEPILTELGLDTPSVFVQGLMICNADGTVRQEHVLDPKVARKVIQYAESQGFEVIAYSGNRLVTKSLSDTIEKITEFGEPMPEEIGSLLNHVTSLKMHKFIIVGGNKRKLKALRWQLDKQLNGSVNFTDGGVLTSLEVLPKGTSKGQGVKTLLRQIGASPENVMAIGDAENDVSLLEGAGFGVAVANASDKTKEVADEVVSSNNDDGVAEAIERFVLPDEPKAEEKPAIEATSTDTTDTDETVKSDDAESSEDATSSDDATASETTDTASDES